MISACGLRLLFCQMYNTPTLLMPLNAPERGIWWPRVVPTYVQFTRAHVLLSATDHIKFSRVLCKRLYSCFICNPQCPLTPPDAPTPNPTPVRHLVVKGGTTAGQHDMSSACGSGCCFDRCTYPLTLMPPQCPQKEKLVAKSGTNLGPVHMTSCAIVTIDCLEFSRVLCKRLYLCLICNPQCPLTPQAAHIPNSHSSTGIYWSGMVLLQVSMICH